MPAAWPGVHARRAFRGAGIELPDGALGAPPASHPPRRDFRNSEEVLENCTSTASRNRERGRRQSCRHPLLERSLGGPGTLHACHCCTAVPWTVTPRRKQKRRVNRKRGQHGNGCPGSLPEPTPAGRALPTASEAHAHSARRRARSPPSSHLPCLQRHPLPSRWPTYSPPEKQAGNRKPLWERERGTKGTDGHARGTGSPPQTWPTAGKNALLDSDHVVPLWPPPK